MSGAEAYQVRHRVAAAVGDGADVVDLESFGGGAAPAVDEGTAAVPVAGEDLGRQLADRPA
jgi:hypothetical protein